MRLIIEHLSKSHDRRGFSSSDESIDLFLKQKALQDQNLDLSRTYVLCDQLQDRGMILGYYTITLIHISQDTIPRDKPKIKREIPALLLGQLGVDVRFQRRGFGELLLLSAESKARLASEVVGIRAMVLDARSQDLVRWYSQYGYSRVGDNLRMAKRIEVIKPDTE